MIEIFNTLFISLGYLGIASALGVGIWSVTKSLLIFVQKKIPKTFREWRIFQQQSSSGRYNTTNQFLRRMDRIKQDINDVRANYFDSPSLHNFMLRSTLQEIRAMLTDIQKTMDEFGQSSMELYTEARSMSELVTNYIGQPSTTASKVNSNYSYTPNSQTTSSNGGSPQSASTGASNSNASSVQSPSNPFIANNNSCLQLANSDSNKQFIIVIMTEKLQQVSYLNSSSGELKPSLTFAPATAKNVIDLYATCGASWATTSQGSLLYFNVQEYSSK